MVNDWQPPKKNAGKVIAVDWQAVSAGLDVSSCVRLNKGEVVAIASILEPLRWATRWQNAPDLDTVKAFVDDLEAKLVTDCNCTDCGEVVLCIEDNIDEIVNLITNNNNFNNYITEIIEAGTKGFLQPVIVPPDNCDDRRFNICVQFVDLLHNDVIDFLEQFELDTNGNELFGSFGLITGADEISVDAVFSLINYIQESVNELYVALYTDEVRDAIACEIFCSLPDNCTVSLEDIWLVYVDLLGYSLEFENLMGLVSSMIFGGTPTNVLMVYFMHILAMAWAKLGGQILPEYTGLTVWAGAFRRYQTMVSVFARGTNGNWDLLCNCATTWEYTFDFSANNGLWVKFNNIEGVYSSGAWRNSYNASFGSNGAWIQKILAETNITYINVVFDRTAGTGQNLAISHGILIYNGATQVGQSNPDAVLVPTPNGTDVQYLWEGDVTATQIQVLCRLGRRVSPNTNVGGSVAIKTITIRGTGVNPFI